MRTAPGGPVAAPPEPDSVRDPIPDRVAALRADIATAAARAGRDPAGIRVVAIVKGAAPEAVRAALAAGLEHLGESRVADAEARRAALGRLTPAPVWHMVGHLQRNKARRALALFDRVDSLDSLRLAQALDRLSEAGGRRLPVLIEVNIAEAAGRHGVAPEALARLAASVEGLENLSLEGLMAIAPQDPPAAERAFDRMAGLWAAQGGGRWPVLSMGMSQDYAAAIAAGATELRIGSAIFHP